MNGNLGLRLLISMTMALALGFGFAALQENPASPEPVSAMIIEGPDVDTVAALVRGVGGRITHELDIIDAVAVRLSPSQTEALRESHPELEFHPDVTVEVSSNGGGRFKTVGNETFYPTLVGADRLHAEGITGAGVTVALIDTQIDPMNNQALSYDTQGNFRFVGGVNLACGYDPVTGIQHGSCPPNGHANHVASIILSSAQTKDGKYNGIAPDAALSRVTAFDGDGRATYANVIEGIDRIVAKKDQYNIRVMNLSFSAPVRSHYWDDPLNKAVMRAWQAGIVVVASAGNTGPDPMSIGVPGNNPYIITVGAMSDNYTPSDPSDDVLASFSATGPTFEGFVKPDIVAPGGHLLGMMDKESKLALDHPEFFDGKFYFTMSGTSQAAAVVSGVVALMLQREPYLTPDDVKSKLMASARPAIESDGSLSYSILQQGAGVVHAYDATFETALTVANRGLDVTQDLNGTAHFGGRANRDAAGNYYIEGLNGYIWSDGYVWSDGYLWSDAYVWCDGYAWSDAYVWSDGYAWSDAYTWSDGYAWSDALTESMSVNTWVSQE